METEKDKNSGKTREPDASQLFLVRVWKDEPGEGDGTGQAIGNRAHGKVQHVLTGKAASFDDWSTLVNLLKGMVPLADRIKDSKPGNTP